MENFDPENFMKIKKNCNHKISKAPAAILLTSQRQFFCIFYSIFIYARIPVGDCDLYNTQKNLIYFFLKIKYK